jgi:hypothetical protein
VFRADVEVMSAGGSVLAGRSMHPAVVSFANHDGSGPSSELAFLANFDYKSSRCVITTGIHLVHMCSISYLSVLQQRCCCQCRDGRLGALGANTPYIRWD